MSEIHRRQFKGPNSLWQCFQSRLDDMCIITTKYKHIVPTGLKTPCSTVIYKHIVPTGLKKVDLAGFYKHIVPTGLETVAIFQIFLKLTLMGRAVAKPIGVNLAVFSSIFKMFQCCVSISPSLNIASVLKDAFYFIKYFSEEYYRLAKTYSDCLCIDRNQFYCF